MIKYIYSDYIIQKYKKAITFTQQNHNDWDTFITKFPNYNLPKTLEELISANTEVLSSIYIYSNTDQYFQKEAEKLKFLYYDMKSGDIIKFFIENRDLLNISTCLYCNMTYVNIFETKEEEILDLLHTASFNELKTILEIIDPSIEDKSIKNFITKLNKNKKSRLEDYKNISGMKTLIDKIISYRVKQQFDIDHFLPKNKCNLISLSINNFIPSCQVCNSRIKSTRNVYRIGMTSKTLECLFPTSPNYNYSNEMKFIILSPNNVKPTSYVKLISDCELLLQPTTSNSVYQKEALSFRIQDRYRYHIIEPLTYLDKLNHFNDTYFNNLKNNSNLNEDEIKFLKESLFDDLFRLKNQRIFEKLYSDLSI
jgi:hypothetical protein